MYVLVALALLCGCAQVWGLHDTTCKGGLTACDDRCVDTLTDRNHCGSCGNACSGSDVCGNGFCGECPVDQLECGGICVDPLFDAANCNGCGNVCSGGNVCVVGECQPPCDTSQLTASITDPWGNQWDGLERSPAPLDAAQVTCKAFGARLPSATELFRVSATQSGTVGMSFHTNYLWSRAADDHLAQATIRLSDGTYSGIAATTATAFRCVCPAPAPATFSGNHCNGDPGNACFEVNGYNVDTKARPALRKSAALSECIADRGHLVDTSLLASAIRSGLPGTNAYVMTADAWNYPTTAQLRWNGVQTAWELTGNLSGIDTTTASPFLCGAAKAIQSPNANAIANVFHPQGSKYTGETADNAASTWVAAHDACFVRGGHLPRSAELGELIEQNLPNGSDIYLWTSDEVGFDGMTNFSAEVHKWMGLDPRWSYAYLAGATNQTATSRYKTDTLPFRCIWYPIDPTYVAPSTCAGGCFEVDLPGDSAAKMWFDSMDRPASGPGAAFGDCAAAGGVLASERDLTEAIRKGLPNGSGMMVPPWIWTSDLGQATLMVVKWTNVDLAFTDQYSAYMSSAAPTYVYGYRCMWTNEYR